MKTNQSFQKFGLRSATAAAILASCVMNFSSCSKYDLDENDPAGWGASIYSYLEEQGNFTNTIRLIEDLGQKEVLAKTGSKTLFVADDAAFERFYANNTWGVKSYDDLKLAQKKLLFNTSMINNSYQINDLSSLEKRIEGMALRHTTAATIYDSVPKYTSPEIEIPNMSPEYMRNNSRWHRLDGLKNVVLMQDASNAPMTHFTQRYMTNNKITDEDLNFLLNGHAVYQTANDAVVNGVLTEKTNIKCSNGFIHQMREVMVPVGNMAQVIASNPKTATFSKMIERFSAPFYAGDEIKEQYNALYGTSVDTVFEKKYFTDQTFEVRKTWDYNPNKEIDQLLKFDPGKNNVYSDRYTGQAATDAMERDMPFIMAPTEEAFEDYWKSTTGSVLIDQYHSVDEIPDNLIKELVNNNFILSLKTRGVPSKFNAILNDASDPMGVKPEHVDSVIIANNGAVFMMKKVFSPNRFVSVLYPPSVNTTMKIIDWAVEANQYTTYLNSLNSYYSFFIPSNDALLTYIDPSSYSMQKGDTVMAYKFHYDAKNTARKVWGSKWYYKLGTQQFLDSIATEPILTPSNDINGKLERIFKDILDNCIVIGNVEDGHEFYRTKGGQEIRVHNASLGSNGMTVEGSYQINETKQPLRVAYIYDQSPKTGADGDRPGNGKCYILENEPILTTRNSVVDMMTRVSEADANKEMSEMVKLIKFSGITEKYWGPANDLKPCARDNNISSFNSYHYTVYAPTNEAILKLYADGTLKDPDSFEDPSTMDDKGKEMYETELEKIRQFVQLHIQDGSLFIKSAPVDEQKYETALIENNAFVRLWVTLTDNNVVIKTSATDNEPVHVKTDNPAFYNIMAREYRLNGGSDQVSTASTAVIHLIDKPIIRKK